MATDNSLRAGLGEGIDPELIDASRVETTI